MSDHDYEPPFTMDDDDLPDYGWADREDDEESGCPKPVEEDEEAYDGPPEIDLDDPSFPDQDD